MSTTKNYGLKLRPKEEDHWELGSGCASQKFGAGDLNPEGDWTGYLVGDELQKIGKLDTQACAVFATLKAWAMLAKYKGFTDFPLDMSERYSGVMCGTTPQGTDPHEVGEITRKKAGAIPQASMPWTADIDTWNEFYNRDMAFRQLPFGKKLLDRFEMGHEWVFAWGSSYTPEQKAERLQEALKRGTVCVSVVAWKKKGKFYTKKDGEQDGHWVTLVKYDGKRAVIHDQYSPFLKTLTENYDFNASKVYFLQPKSESNRNFMSVIWDNFATLWRGLKG